MLSYDIICCKFITCCNKCSCRTFYVRANVNRSVRVSTRGKYSCQCEKGLTMAPNPLVCRYPLPLPLLFCAFVLLLKSPVFHFQMLAAM